MSQLQDSSIQWWKYGFNKQLPFLPPSLNTSLSLDPACHAPSPPLCSHLPRTSQAMKMVPDFLCKIKIFSPLFSSLNWLQFNFPMVFRSHLQSSVRQWIRNKYLIAVMIHRTASQEAATGWTQPPSVKFLAPWSVRHPGNKFLNDCIFPLRF